jgi:hypothetical protein
MPIDFNSYSKLPQFGLSVVSQKKTALVFDDFEKNPIVANLALNSHSKLLQLGRRSLFLLLLTLAPPSLIDKYFDIS